MFTNMKKIYYLLLLLIAVSNSSCDDKFFDLEFPPQPLIISVTNLDQAVGGVYYGMMANEGQLSNFDNLAVYAASVGDEGAFISKAGNITSVRELYDRNNTNENERLNWAFIPSYDAIRHANLWINNIDEGLYTDLAGQEKIPPLKGELYFLRAYCYWVLVKMYHPSYQKGGDNSYKSVPLVKTGVPIGLDEAVDAPAGTTEEIYALIKSDLIEAKKLLPEEPLRAGGTNKFAASALLARVLFQMQDFAAAKSECDFVIDQNGGRFDLSQEPIETWNKYWSGYNANSMSGTKAKELLWFFSTGDGSVVANGLGGTRSQWNVPRAWGIFNMHIGSALNTIPGGGGGETAKATDRTLAISQKLLQKVGWATADSLPTPEALQDKRFSQLYYYNPSIDPVFSGIARRYWWIDKYYRGPQDQYRYGAIPLIRLAEMYLTRSIIRFNDGDKPGASSDLNVVRKRAGLTDVLAADITADMIHNERWKELSFESDRLFYLQALKINIPNGDRGSGELPFNSPTFLWPIPQREKELNPSL
jgi:starch-binding outer membrane protein, SusD/RagB family